MVKMRLEHFHLTNLVEQSKLEHCDQWCQRTEETKSYNKTSKDLSTLFTCQMKPPSALNHFVFVDSDISCHILLDLCLIDGNIGSRTNW